MIQPVSGDFKGVTVRQAVDLLTSKAGVKVQVLGDVATKITVHFDNLPLQLALKEIQRASGVALDARWIPEIRPGGRFSVCVSNAKASVVANLFQVITGQPVQLPSSVKDRVIPQLKLANVTADEAVGQLISRIP